MKNIRRFFLVLFLIVVLAYVTNITSIPDSIILFKGEEIELGTIYGIYIDKNYDTIETISNINGNDILEKNKISLKLFNLINIKEVEVNTIPKAKVIPLGNSVGLKLYTSGVLVVGKTEVKGEKPYESTRIKEGDMIIGINEAEITCTQELIESVNSSKGNSINIKYLRDGKEYVDTMAPTKVNENEYKLGLWVRDGAAGIGTITYYEPATGKYAALGHGIIDIDTEKLINISSGELVTARISSIIKGEKGNPRRN